MRVVKSLSCMLKIEWSLTRKRDDSGFPICLEGASPSLDLYSYSLDLLNIYFLLNESGLPLRFELLLTIHYLETLLSFGWLSSHTIVGRGCPLTLINRKSRTIVCVRDCHNPRSSLQLLNLNLNFIWLFVVEILGNKGVKLIHCLNRVICVVAD